MSKSIKILMMILSLLSLAVILVTAGMVFNRTMDLDTYKLYTLIATIVWFITSPFWMISHGEKRNEPTV